MEIPIVPNFLIGQEPILNQLVQFIEEHQFTDDDLLTDVEEYQSDVNNSGYFFLFGNLKMYPDEPITTEKIKEAIRKNNDKQKKLGPENTMDSLRIETIKNNFISFLKLLEVYYQHTINELSDREYFLYDLSSLCEL